MATATVAVTLSRWKRREAQGVQPDYLKRKKRGKSARRYRYKSHR